MFHNKNKKKKKKFFQNESSKVKERDENKIIWISAIHVIFPRHQNEQKYIITKKRSPKFEFDTNSWCGFKVFKNGRIEASRGTWVWNATNFCLIYSLSLDLGFITIWGGSTKILYMPQKGLYIFAHFDFDV